MIELEKIVIVGEGETAEIACEYFTYDSPHKVEAFAVEERFLNKSSVLERPIVHLEDLQERYPPDVYGVYVALSYTQLNSVGTRLL